MPSNQYLHPCPCCGSSNIIYMTQAAMKAMVNDTAYIEPEPPEEYHYVICDGTQGGCGTMSGWSKNTDSVSKQWNRRSNGR